MQCHKPAMEQVLDDCMYTRFLATCDPLAGSTRCYWGPWEGAQPAEQEKPPDFFQETRDELGVRTLTSEVPEASGLMGGRRIKGQKDRCPLQRSEQRATCLQLTCPVSLAFQLCLAIESWSGGGRQEGGRVEATVPGCSCMGPLSYSLLDLMLLPLPSRHIQAPTVPR